MKTPKLTKTIKKPRPRETGETKSMCFGVNVHRQPSPGGRIDLGQHAKRDADYVGTQSEQSQRRGRTHGRDVLRQGQAGLVLRSRYPLGHTPRPRRLPRRPQCPP